MGSPIYRNLDQPLRILGFQAGQLIVLAISLVVGGEVFSDLGFNRVWSFVVSIFLAVVFFSSNRILGRQYISRLLRFISLPRILPRQIVSHRRWS